LATADLTVIALGRADASASEYVAEIQRHLERRDKPDQTLEDKVRSVQDRLT
jgi:uncharacterized protein YqgV (UPF0045/DUF77 family)